MADALGFDGFDLAFNRGDRAYLDFTVTQATTGLPQDISGWSISFTAKHRVTDADAAAVILTKTVANGGVVLTSPTTGVGYVTLAPADTAALPAGRISLFADLQGKDPAGNVYTLKKGRLRVLADVTIAS